MNVGLLCAGLTTLDVAVRPVDQLPQDEATRLVEGVTLSAAGTAAGCAVIAARLGVPTRLAGRVGDDAAGRLVRSLLTAEGVDVRLLERDVSRPTSTTVLAIDSQGRRPNFHAPGASRDVVASPAWTSAARASAFVHWAGVGSPNLDGGPGEDLLRAAKTSGATVTLDLISPGRRTMAELERLLPHVAYVLPSLSEARRMTGCEAAADVARALLDLGAGACVLKDGRDGAILYRTGSELRIPAYPVRAVDTTSCGDGWCAGFIAALSRGWAVEDAARFASATAALVAADMGTLGAVKSFEAVEAFMQEAQGLASA